ncbi:hypothetical protein F511_47007 [Dorcoceras hygrometricum]|uniref:Uncharacterized protein n=1 Tax=Dorcoceras hygrometricum TaxID=472368 RepID=A0A2Z6ZYJ2_9LAMI|nr:hypothetical protein F511_47007 [Dorcoceras hygrometricum]
MIQQMLFALINQSQDPVASYSGSSRKHHFYCLFSRQGIQTQEDKSIAAEEDSGEAIDKPAGQPDASTAHPVESF